MKKESDVLYIRGVPILLKRKFKIMCIREGKSINDMVIELLEERCKRGKGAKDVEQSSTVTSS